MMNTNWTTPKTNIIAGMNDLRHALASGVNARLVRAYNKDCAYPIKVKNTKVINDFREYTFTYGIPTSINKIKADTNLSEFEKHLSLNYVSVFGSQEARDRYYATGVCDADNFKNMGCNHLVKVDDYIKFLHDTKDFERAHLYMQQYRNPENIDVQHFFSYFRLRIAQQQFQIKDIKRKVWVVEMLKDSEPKAKIPTLVHVLNFILKPMKYIPRKSVLQMPDYKVVTYRVGAVTNGLSIDIHVPKKFSFN
jgi:hypothetical protein